MDTVKNFVKVTLSAGYDDIATEVDLIFADGVKLPVVPPYNLVWWNATDYPDPADDPGVEIVRVTDLVDDTLTITRAQEGTAASDHNLAGKTYKMIAGITVNTIIDMIGDVFQLSGAYVSVSTPTDAIDVNALLVQVGDVEGAGVGTRIVVDNSLNLVGLAGEIGTDQTASASGPVGTVVAKLPIQDLSGTLIGYIPIYGSIT